MKLPISRRLLACCDYVHPGDRVADIGCDHGYLGIHLLQHGIASKVYAGDIRPGPLDAARQNGQKFGMTDRMQFFLSDGAKAIPHDFDTLVCAGMGADVMVSILDNAPWLRSNAYRLILQCQSRTPILRKYLSENGWEIRQENVLRDGRFLYTIMEVIWNPYVPLTPGQCYLPPALLTGNGGEKGNYIHWVMEHLQLTVTNQKEHAPELARLALKELDNQEETV